MIDPRSPNFESPPFSPGRASFVYGVRPKTTERFRADLAEPPRIPAVTVITPFFNTGAVFHQTAACVMGQSLQDFEWVIVNDRSTDADALAILDQYRPGGERNPGADPRIRIIDHSSNHGLSAARNTGFRAARAPRVFQLDSDDLIEPTTLEKCALFLDANPDFAFVKGFSVGFEGQQYLWDKGFHDRERFLSQNLVTATAMIRREVHARVGGFDETIRGGMEDWEFWLRAASMGCWGATIPEFLDWYRRRPPQVFDAWANLKCEDANRRFKERMHREHAGLFEGGFPNPQRPWHMPYDALWDGPKWANLLDKPEGRQRLLMIVPWFRMGGADRFNLDLVKFLTGRGWEVTLVATLSSGVSPGSSLGCGHPWLADFARYTPDIFILPHLAKPPQFPGIVRHLIDSRRPDHVLITNSEQGYAMLPWLRAACPDPVYLDFNHMEEPQWKAGGHPRHGAAAQGLLDLNITVSDHLRRWMSLPPRDADLKRIEYCHINADTERWRPDPERRAALRTQFGISDDAVVVLYAARFCPQKQPLVFADSVRRLKALLGSSSPPVHILIAGEGELEPQLREALAPLGPLDTPLKPAPTYAGARADTGGADEASDDVARPLARFTVHFLGAVRTDDMPGVMAASDIFFLPSEWEGIALSIYEAMSSGLAVLGAVVGGQPELVTPETGILLNRPKNDPAAEAAAYARVLAELIADPARRSELGRAARERIVKHFELANMGARMLRLFDRAAELKRTRPRPALDRHLARELAAANIESLRAQDLADYLWQYRVRFYEKQHSTQRVEQDNEAAQALRHIASSLSYRLILGLKKLPPYRAFARARYGSDWTLHDPARAEGSPRERLERILSSRSYQLVVRMKRLPPFRLVSRVRHGPNHLSTLPTILREH